MVNAADFARADAKATLKTALQTYHGNTKHPAVSGAIAHLASLSPEAVATRSPLLVDDQWLLISAPSFPGGVLNDDGTYGYTLGRLAFNMFCPLDLQLVIDRVMQPVVPVPGSVQLTHDIHVTFTLRDARFPVLQGMVQNLGVCEPFTDGTLAVEFTGGKLLPVANTDRHQWQTLFGNPRRQWPTGVKAGLSTLMLKLLFGLVPPQQMDAATGELQFAMTRSPRGQLEIRYLDQDLRITQGERGTVLVCERLTKG